MDGRTSARVDRIALYIISNDIKKDRRTKKNELKKKNGMKPNQLAKHTGHIFELICRCNITHNFILKIKDTKYIYIYIYL